MLITICDGDRIANVDLTDDCPIENLVALVIADLENDSHDAAAVRLLKEGVDVLGTERSKTLAECGLSNGDLLMYSYSSSSFSFAPPVPVSSPAAAPAVPDVDAPSTSSASADPLDAARKRLAELVGIGMKQIKKQKLLRTPEQEEEEECRKLFKDMHKPYVKSNIFTNWPALHEQFLKAPTDYDGFKSQFLAYLADQRQKEDMMNSPFSQEGQKMVMERIRLENCERLKQEAMDKMPEAFVPVHMLYVRLVVNGIPTIGFVDSGAQISLMSHDFAKKADLENKIDTRENGIVSGIGGADRKVGIIWSCSFEMGDAKFDAQVNVMNDKYDVLIGLDFMRRHKCCIDLARNRLAFDENVYAEFLSDGEIKEWGAGRELNVHHSFKVDEEKLTQLMGMGFNKKDAEKALTDCVNDLPDAVRNLYYLAQKDAEAIAQAEGTTGAETDKKMEE